MKLISKTKDDRGRAVLNTSEWLLCFKRKRSFVATEESPSGYWKWLELPNKNLVHDHLSFQLDTWNREA